MSATIAKATGKMEQYIKNRSFDDKYFKDMIIEFIRQNGQASRDEINNLVLDKLPDILDENQRLNKVRNLLYALSKREQSIVNQGTNRHPVWKAFDKLLDEL